MSEQSEDTMGIVAVRGRHPLPKDTKSLTGELVKKKKEVETSYYLTRASHLKYQDTPLLL